MKRASVAEDRFVHCSCRSLFLGRAQDCMPVESRDHYALVACSIMIETLVKDSEHGMPWFLRVLPCACDQEVRAHNRLSSFCSCPPDIQDQAQGKASPAYV